MENTIEMEILRLVKEIAKDEEELVKAEKNSWSKDRAESCRNAIERKLELLRILKK